MIEEKLLNVVSKIAEVKECKIIEKGKVLIEFTINDNGKDLTFSVPLSKNKKQIIFNMLAVKVNKSIIDERINLGSCMHVLTIIQRELMKG